MVSDIVTQRDVVVSRADPLPASIPASNVVTLDITHDGEFIDRQWERVRLSLLDAQGNPVVHPVLEQDIVLRTAYGSAEFQPEILSVLDFANGRAEVSMLPLGRRGIVIEAIPFKSLSEPMRYAK